ncbi:hypothetical protein BCR37DRAFT_377249 [Protomyces lactucae-debilis]|uniref:Uncharacterized protein n=1 Tax=Protomyces lactucae-debilis TaxID=2754530 RepID=A0A1Y2FNI6_PROLT|nr:uncharacterized protein BCR37DRAFT_377249 [Protomyces lactucae-debilis]ORY85570.1 hypothetical protein BCR37DRAFT_377249 [Protomyces lactucae-debilis]
MKAKAKLLPKQAQGRSASLHIMSLWSSLGCFYCFSTCTAGMQEMPGRARSERKQESKGRKYGPGAIRWEVRH